MENAEDFVTVEYMFRICEKLIENGYGNTKVKCQDSFVHEDEVCVYPGDFIQFRGNLFNEPVTEKVTRLKKELDEAINRFYQQ